MEVKRYPIRGALYGLLIGLMAAYFAFFRFTMFGLDSLGSVITKFAIIVVAGMLLGIVWAFVAPARKPKAAGAPAAYDAPPAAAVEEPPPPPLEASPPPAEPAFGAAATVTDDEFTESSVEEMAEPFAMGDDIDEVEEDDVEEVAESSAEAMADPFARTDDTDDEEEEPPS